MRDADAYARAQSGEAFADEVIAAGRDKARARAQHRSRTFLATPRYAGILAHVNAKPATVAELSAATGIGEAQLYRMLNRGRRAGLLGRTRLDRSGAPWRWHLTPFGWQYAQDIADPQRRLMISSGYVLCPAGDGWHDYPPCTAPDVPT